MSFGIFGCKIFNKKIQKNERERTSDFIYPPPSSDAWFECGMNLDGAANQITGLISLHSRDVRMNDHHHAFIIPRWSWWVFFK